MSLTLMHPVVLMCVLLCAPTAHGVIQPLTRNAYSYLNAIFRLFVPDFQSQRACHLNLQFAVMTFGRLHQSEFQPPGPHFIHVDVDSVDSSYNYFTAVPNGPSHSEEQLISAFNNIEGPYDSPPSEVYIFTLYSPCIRCARNLQQLARDNPDTNFIIGYVEPYRDTLSTSERHLMEPNIYFGEIGGLCPAHHNHDELKRKRSSTCKVITCDDKRVWRDDLRCGGDYVAPNGKIAECNPEGIYPCCSPYNWCGNTADHCDCEECIDYRVTG